MESTRKIFTKSNNALLENPPVEFLDFPEDQLITSMAREHPPPARVPNNFPNETSIDLGDFTVPKITKKKRSGHRSWQWAPPGDSSPEDPGGEILALISFDGKLRMVFCCPEKRRWKITCF